MFSVVCVCPSVLGCGVPVQGCGLSPLSVQGRGPTPCTETWLWSSRYAKTCSTWTSLYSDPPPSPEMFKLVQLGPHCTVILQTYSDLMKLSSLYRDPYPPHFPRHVQTCSTLYKNPLPGHVQIYSGIVHTIDKRRLAFD